MPAVDHQVYSGRHTMHEPAPDTPDSGEVPTFSFDSLIIPLDRHFSSPDGKLACMDALRRDWAKLPRDLAAEIAGCLLGIDVSEYIRFRAVCKPWRRSTDDPRGVLSSRFFPRNWVMLTNYGEGGDDDTRRRRLLNVATGASIADDFPEFSGHHPLGCADGLLVLENTATSGGIRLVNPLTHAITDLPDPSSSTSVSALKAATGWGTGLSYRGFGVIDGGGGGAMASPATATVVVFISGKVPLLAFIRPGESHWALADTSALTCGAHQVSVLSLRGRFYLSTSTGDVLAVELHPVPRLVHVVRNRKTTPPPATAAATVPAATSCSFYLAPSGSGNDDGAAGMLMIMAHTSGENEFVEQVEQVEVFEVDVDGRRLIPRSAVVVNHDRALFVGLVRALSVSTKLFPSIAGSANAVYFCHGQGFRGELFRVFHVDDGRAEPAVELEFFEQMQGRERPFFGPFNLDIYLACCVDVFFFC